MENKFLYVVFSATPFKIGSAIRTVTCSEYNHVSISFDPNLRTLYSFARYYKGAPFYGGLVRETPARFKNNGKIADICVCALPVTDAEIKIVKSEIKEMFKASQNCYYNLYSAAFSMFSQRVFIRNCYTCAEFVVHILSLICPQISNDKFYSIEDLREILCEHEIYSGAYPDIENEQDPDYERSISPLDLFYYTVKGEVELIKSIVKK